MNYNIKCIECKTAFQANDDTFFPLVCPGCNMTSEEGVLWVIS